MQPPSLPQPVRALLPSRTSSPSPSGSDAVTLVDLPPTYDSVAPRLHRAPRKHGTLSSYRLGPLVYPARSVVTFLALVTSIALIGTTAQALRDYSSATKVLTPDSDPIAFDLRATQLSLACGVYISVVSLSFLIVAFALWRSTKSTHPPTRHRLLHPTLFTLLTLPALFLALFTLAYNISNSTSSITSTSGIPALNYASCYYSSLAQTAALASAAPSGDPSIFGTARRRARNAGSPAMADLGDSETLENAFVGICAESRVGQVLLLMVVMLEMAGSVVVGWGWWAILRGNGKRGSGGDEREGRRGRRARGEKRRVWKGAERV